MEVEKEYVINNDLQKKHGDVNNILTKMNNMDIEDYTELDPKKKYGKTDIFKYICDCHICNNQAIKDFIRFPFTYNITILKYLYDMSYHIKLNYNFYALVFKKLGKCVVPKSFDVDHQYELNDFCLGFDIRNSYIKTYIKELNKIYLKKIDIKQPFYRPKLVNSWSHRSQNGWYRFNVIKNYIFISDYSGFKIYDNKLNVLYNKRISQEFKYYDVIGFDIKKDSDKKELLLWSVNECEKITSQTIFNISNLVPSKIITKYRLGLPFL